MKYVFWLLLGLSLAPTGTAQPIRLAVASDLRYALPEILTLFEREYPGSQVEVSYGSSGHFYYQLRQGAPFDLYLSADNLYTESLEADGFIAPGTRVHYATGRIVVWAHERLGFSTNLSAPKMLNAPQVERVVIANPQHAPYGYAAISYLEGQGLQGALEPKLLYGDNIAHAAQLALNAGEVGILALALAIHPSLDARGVFVVIPLDEHAPLYQEMVIMQGRDTQAVRALHTFMQSEAAREILRQYGFELP